MKHYTFLWTLFLLLSFSGQITANWQRSITNYSRHDYYSGNQNWKIIQHENGWMYFANNNGLLEFDGVEWNTYPIYNSKVRALKAASDGRIYVGGMGQFGYFTPNPLGSLDYFCLSDSISKDENVGIIWNIHITDGRVYFQSDWRIFYLENDELHIIRSGSSIHNSAIVHNKFYYIADDGMYMLNGNESTLLINSEGLRYMKIVSILPYFDKMMLVSSRNGIYIYDNRTLERYESPAEDFILSNQLFCAAFKDSLLALGSVQDGVLLLNVISGEIEKISITNGLQNRTILAATFDRENNLWLGLDNGIDCINLKSPLFSLFGNKSMIGSGYSTSLYKDKFYYGTNQGLYVSGKPIIDDNKQDITFIPGTEGQVWSLSQYDDKLFCLSDNGIFVLEDDKIEHLRSPLGIWSIVPLTNYPDILVAGSYSGLFILKKMNGKWQLANRLNEFYYSCKTMYAEDSNNIWVANKERGIFRLTLSDQLDGFSKIKNYKHEELTPNYDTHITQIDNELVFSTPTGLFKYNPIKDVLEKYTSLEEQLEGSVNYTYLKQTENRNIWYVSDGMFRIARYNTIEGQYTRNENELYLKNSLIANFENLNMYDDSYAVIGTNEGFSLLQFNKINYKENPLNLTIREVNITKGKDSLIYGRSFAHEDILLRIPYHQNSIRIKFSANNYDKSISTFYSYKLISGSKESEWSSYKEISSKEYTDLYEGKYTFMVKVITDQNSEPVITSFDFQILPPWYRSWWAFVIYLGAVISLFYYLHYLYAKSRKRLISQKDQEIIRQKQIFKKETALKDQTIDSLREETLQSELRHKSEELIHSTLNIVRKNEILQEIKKDAIGIIQSIKDDNMISIRRKTLRLISHIDNNLEHDNDLQTFQSNFDTIHQNFFNYLNENYSQLNHKEKMLCCYIKMNLMSKEIAPLLNISVRGVEISRYRLRKKLNLTEKESLAEFLQNLAR